MRGVFRNKAVGFYYVLVQMISVFNVDERKDAMRWKVVVWVLAIHDTQFMHNQQPMTLTLTPLH